MQLCRPQRVHRPCRHDKLTVLALVPMFTDVCARGEGGGGTDAKVLTISATLLQRSGRCIEKWYRFAQHITAHSASSLDRPQSITIVLYTIKFSK